MSRTVTTPSRTRVTAPEETPKCSGHGRRCKPMVAGPTTKNPGRVFYACPLSRDDPKRCKFFQWADEGTGNTLQTPSKAGPSLPPTPPRTAPAAIPAEIDWSKVDTDSLEREAIASTPSSSQKTTDGARSTLLSPGKRRLEEDPVTPRKRLQFDSENPFLSPSAHPATSSVLSSLEELSEELHRRDRLIKAGEAAKEGFRKTIVGLRERNEELERRVQELERQLGGDETVKL